MISTGNNTKIETMTSGVRLHKVESLKRLMKLTLPYIGKIVLAAVCVLLVNTAQLLKPYILKVVIDDFLMKHVWQKGHLTITSMGIFYFIVVALGGLFSIAQANLINKAGQEIMKNLRSKVFKTIQLLPLSYLDKTSSGRLITRGTNDIESLSEMYTDVILSLFQDIFLLIGIVYAMVALDVRLAIISFGVVPFMFLIIFLLKNKVKRNFYKVKKLIGEINGFMAENISGMRIVQIFRGEREKKEEFLKLNDEYYKSMVFQVWLISFLKPAADFFLGLAISILIWYGMGKISNHTLELGVLYAFTTYIKQFFNPISDLADSYTTIQSALISADRIFELLDQEEELEDLDKGISMERMKGNIEFKNVWFSYNGIDWILKNISFKLVKGQTAAFVGETGAGKTTIISLISRFYQVQKGEILIDGININDIKLKDLRKSISVVLQDAFLFSGDIEKNITLNDDIEEDQIMEALKTSCAMDFVEGMEGGIHEPVMERGSTFSAGERQLLAFARAISRNPSIFVLDEATANIDTHTEKLIQKAIEGAAKNRTTLVIAHRLSTIRNADVIIVLKQGKIIEMGSHEELLEKRGYYKTMIEKSEYENKKFQFERV
jgi:ATP-binding cassette, subfamily B, multidrug efflux pump